MPVVYLRRTRRNDTLGTGVVLGGGEVGVAQQARAGVWPYAPTRQGRTGCEGVCNVVKGTGNEGGFETRPCGREWARGAPSVKRALSNPLVVSSVRLINRSCQYARGYIYPGTLHSIHRDAWIYGTRRARHAVPLRVTMICARPDSCLRRNLS